MRERERNVSDTSGHPLDFEIRTFEYCFVSLLIYIKYKSKYHLGCFFFKTESIFISVAAKIIANSAMRDNLHALLAVLQHTPAIKNGKLKVN